MNCEKRLMELAFKELCGVTNMVLSSPAAVKHLQDSLACLDLTTVKVADD